MLCKMKSSEASYPSPYKRSKGQPRAAGTHSWRCCSASCTALLSSSPVWRSIQRWIPVFKATAPGSRTPSAVTNGQSRKQLLLLSQEKSWVPPQPATSARDWSPWQTQGHGAAKLWSFRFRQRTQWCFLLGCMSQLHPRYIKGYVGTHEPALFPKPWFPQKRKRKWEYVTGLNKEPWAFKAHKVQGGTPHWSLLL